jgi:hypothetical protein
MKEHVFPQDERQLEDGLQRLIEDLKRLNTSDSKISIHDQESLSLIVDEALKGIDIRQRYPAFFDRLLRSSALRSQFIECVLDLREIDDPTEGMAFPVKPADLAFLHSAQPENAKNETHWKVRLQRSAEQLMAAFFAPQLNFRGSESAAEPGITLLRSEFLMQGATYSVMLQGRLHDTRDDVLQLSLNVAASEGDFQPLQSTLEWGSFKSCAPIDHEGDTPLPDLPFSSVFNDSQDKIEAELYLTLTVAA